MRLISEMSACPLHHPNPHPCGGIFKKNKKLSSPGVLPSNTSIHTFTQSMKAKSIRVLLVVCSRRQSLWIGLARFKIYSILLIIDLIHIQPEI